MRNQVLVLKTDALPAGRITKWEWRSDSSKGFKAGDYADFKLMMGHTARSGLSGTFANNYKGTPVDVLTGTPLHVNSYPVNSWVPFAFTTPFAYNGADNLIVEVWWVDSNPDVGGATRYGNVGAGREVYAQIYNGRPLNGYPDRGAVSSYMHYMRLTITPSGAPVEPTSLGRVKAIFN